jgi:hypothetical protein
MYTTLKDIVITEPAAIVLTETHVDANCNGLNRIDRSYVAGAQHRSRMHGAMELPRRILLIYQPEHIM